MTRTKIKRYQIEVEDLLIRGEMEAGWKTIDLSTSLGYDTLFPLPIVSTHSIDRTIVVESHPIVEEILPGHIVSILEGPAFGDYTVESVSVSTDTLTVRENLENTLGIGTYAVYLPPASGRIGVDSRLYGVDTLDEILSGLNVRTYPKQAARDSVNPHLVYVGRATTENPELGAPVWQIYRQDIANLNSPRQYANGSLAYSFRWSERETLAYGVLP
jgi:hypothetical protein